MQQPTTEVFEGGDQGFYWRLVGEDGHILARSVESYATEYGARRGLVRTARIIRDMKLAELRV